MSAKRSRRLIPAQESLEVEFKSDLKRLRDDELVATVACLANTEGGTVYLGVEKDGTVTGLHPEHENLTAGYVRQAGLDAARQQVLIEQFLDQHQEIRRGDVIELCGIGPHQATRLLQAMVGKGNRVVVRSSLTDSPEALLDAGILPNYLLGIVS